MDKKILPVIDANLNRLLEGLRVCEDIMRFLLSDEQLTLEFKKIRHNVISTIKKWRINNNLLLDSRDVLKDAGKSSVKSELERSDYKNIFFANIQRAKESVRVLEEFSKLDNRIIPDSFKNIRYNLYQLEKKANSRL